MLPAGTSKCLSSTIQAKRALESVGIHSSCFLQVTSMASHCSRTFYVHLYSDRKAEVLESNQMDIPERILRTKRGTRARAEQWVEEAGRSSPSASCVSFHFDVCTSLGAVVRYAGCRRRGEWMIGSQQRLKHAPADRGCALAPRAHLSFAPINVPSLKSCPCTGDAPDPILDHISLRTESICSRSGPTPQHVLFWKTVSSASTPLGR